MNGFPSWSGDGKPTATWKLAAKHSPNTLSEGPCPGAVPVSIATALHGSSGPRVNYMTFKACGIDSSEEEKYKTRKAKKIGSSSHCNQFAGRRILTKFTENTFKRAACRLASFSSLPRENIRMWSCLNWLVNGNQGSRPGNITDIMTKLCQSRRYRANIKTSLDCKLADGMPSYVCGCNQLIRGAYM